MTLPKTAVSPSPLVGALVFCTLVFLLLRTSLPRNTYAQSPQPVFVDRIPGPDFVVTVTEGPGEPRSIGSYAIRLYSPYDQAWPYNNFTDGIVHKWDGGVESLLFQDIDEDTSVDVIVVVRSARSGGYLSAAVYRVIDDRLNFTAHVEWLDRMADTVAALRRVVELRNKD